MAAFRGEDGGASLEENNPTARVRQRGRPGFTEVSRNIRAAGRSYEMREYFATIARAVRRPSTAAETMPPA